MTSKRLVSLLIGIAVFSAAVFAQRSSIEVPINEKISQLIDSLYAIAPPVILGVLTFAGIIYAMGQAFDAQTRTKAQNWSMGMVTGAVLGMIIIIVAPWIVNLLLGA